MTLRYPLEKAIVGVVISLILKKYEAKAYLKSLLQWEKVARNSVTDEVFLRICSLSLLRLRKNITLR